MNTRTLALVAALTLVLLFDSLALPLMPEAILRFIERAFKLRGWPQVVLFNDLFGIFVGLFWVGLMGAVSAFVLPREEGYLALVLSKPITRADYVRGHLIPLALQLGGAGFAVSLIMTVKLAVLNGLDGLSATTVFATGLGATLFALALVALTCLVCIVARDTYSAIVGGFLLFSAVVIPAGGYMYRPDLYVGKAALANALVFPANLLWHAEVLLARLPLLTLIAALTGAVSATACIKWMERRDVE